MTFASIIICTRNRANSLPSTLNSIEVAIRSAPNLVVEVIIVDNASDDDTQQVATNWSASVPFNASVLFEPRKGLSYARNTGIKAAVGQILVFTDDDCALKPDYLIMLEHYYARDMHPTLRGGRVELGCSDDLPFSIKLDNTARRMTALDHPGGFIIGANMTMHRDVIATVGLFDVRFGAGAPFIAGEDTDFLYRCFLKHVPVEYVPDMIVKHFHGRRDKEAIASLNHGYHVGSGALYAKYILQWGLTRHLYWDTRKFLRELAGGRTLDREMGLSYKALWKGTLQGMILYWSVSVLAGLGVGKPQK